eukprot:5664425-Amphidinium_carterae.1
MLLGCGIVAVGIGVWMLLRGVNLTIGCMSEYLLRLFGNVVYMCFKRRHPPKRHFIVLSADVIAIELIQDRVTIWDRIGQPWPV